MPLSQTDLIWNRAALESGGNAARAGDRALADLLLAHGMVMNGGVGHAVEALSLEEFSAALIGFRFFGFDEVALLLEGALKATEQDHELADRSYGSLIPNDQVLVERFEACYRFSPGGFCSYIMSVYPARITSAAADSQVGFVFTSLISNAHRNATRISKPQNDLNY